MTGGGQEVAVGPPLLVPGLLAETVPVAPALAFLLPCVPLSRPLLLPPSITSPNGLPQRPLSQTLLSGRRTGERVGTGSGPSKQAFRMGFWNWVNHQADGNRPHWRQVGEGRSGSRSSAVPKVSPVVLLKGTQAACAVAVAHEQCGRWRPRDYRTGWLL